MMRAAGTTQTHPADAVWREAVPGYRRWEKTTTLGSGGEVWGWATAEVLRWGVKTRSGFSVTPATTVATGIRPVILAHPFGLSIREPVEVVDVVETPNRVGFAYRTLPGHPVSGEEAFIVHRRGDEVLLTIRSLTRAADSPRWRLAYPGLLLAQKVARLRYLRALRIRATHRKPPPPAV
ncbi:DUF1990 family protein [Microbacterium kyungheense]|uniref:Uncharacterized protein (UPF0548 family) n=1 Tax=Microbacterium kyungheense TaxID=1263636 RepID=A0A543FIS8_9MICO|nr:DUF1990 family protein [Microbacterium kyungheense]TQM33768.1 uncharacterized protein (UPF0548 family) [Microbacterium kyungheense]